MEVTACHRYANISPRKARLVIDTIRGKPVELVLEQLLHMRRRAAPMIRKVIQAAVAGASEEHNVDPDELYVARAWVDEGPRRRWHQFRARGVWNRILHRTSHIHVVLSDEKPSETEESDTNG